MHPGTSQAAAEACIVCEPLLRKTHERRSGVPRRVEEIFHRILAVPPEKRVETLDMACAGDADNPPGGGVAAGFCRQGPGDLEWTEALRTCPPDGTPDPNLGRRIGPTRFSGKLGAGGMGNVYLAIQTEPSEERSPSS